MEAQFHPLQRLPVAQLVLLKKEVDRSMAKLQSLTVAALFLGAIAGCGQAVSEPRTVDTSAGKVVVKAISV